MSDLTQLDRIEWMLRQVLRFHGLSSEEIDSRLQVTEPPTSPQPYPMGTWFQRQFPNKVGAWHRVDKAEWIDGDWPRWHLACSCGGWLMYKRRGYEYITAAEPSGPTCTEHRA